MTMTAQRDRNLAKARQARQRRLADRRREQAKAYAKAKPIYDKACRDYYATLAVHGEGSPEEREAFGVMLAAEVDWFNAYPKGETHEAHA
jgi:hypothetical protein